MSHDQDVLPDGGAGDALGDPALLRPRDQADIARAWKQVLGRVGSFADLEPALLGRVEELIDFVTADQGDR